MAYLGMLGAIAIGLASPYLADALRPPNAARPDARTRRRTVAGIALGLAAHLLLRT